MTQTTVVGIQKEKSHLQGKAISRVILTWAAIGGHLKILRGIRYCLQTVYMYVEKTLGQALQKEIFLGSKGDWIGVRFAK